MTFVKFGEKSFDLTKLESASVAKPALEESEGSDAGLSPVRLASIIIKTKFSNSSSNQSIT